MGICRHSIATGVFSLVCVGHKNSDNEQHIGERRVNQTRLRGRKITIMAALGRHASMVRTDNVKGPRIRDFSRLLYMCTVDAFIVGMSSPDRTFMKTKYYRQIS